MIRDEVFEILRARQGQPVKTQELTRRLWISAQQVYDAIMRLRAEGKKIINYQGRGYVYFREQGKEANDGMPRG